MPTVIGVDPGQTSGYAVLSVPEDALLGAHSPDDKLHKHVKINGIGQIDCTPPWENRGANIITELMTEYYPHDSVFVIEDFIVDMQRMDKGRHTLSPVRVTAKIEAMLWVDPMFAGYHIEDRIFFQSAQLAKTTCTDDRLKEWKLYDRNSGQHARDAMRHAYYFLRSCRGNSLKAAEKRYQAFPNLYNDPIPAGKRPQKSIAIRKRELGQRIEGL